MKTGYWQFKIMTYGVINLKINTLWPSCTKSQCIRYK